MSIASNAEYVLGHCEAELQRLALQAALVEPITRQLLVDAGITDGMRVLDVGTGCGDVAFFAAELVGESGTVVGIDRAPAALAGARSRRADRRAVNVSFENEDAGELAVLTLRARAETAGRIGRRRRRTARAQAPTPGRERKPPRPQLNLPSWSRPSVNRTPLSRSRHGDTPSTPHPDFMPASSPLDRVTGCPGTGVRGLR
jgi:SAM-dependent methyltransferase